MFLMRLNFGDRHQASFLAARFKVAATFRRAVRFVLALTAFRPLVRFLIAAFFPAALRFRGPDVFFAALLRDEDLVGMRFSLIIVVIVVFIYCLCTI